MSRWRNVNPAKYAPKQDILGDIATGFANVYVPAVMKQAELDEKRKYEEEKERKQRAAAAARAAKAQDEKDKKLARNAKILAEQFTGTKNNSDAVVYFTQQLQLMDGDVADVLTMTENRVKSGQVEFTTETNTRQLQMQGPDYPRNEPLPKGVTVGETTYTSTKAGTPITPEKLPAFAANENNPQEIRDETAQMAEIFAPVSEEPTVDVEKTTYGVKVNPYGKQADKLDTSRLTTLEDIEMYELAIENGDINLNDKSLAIIEERKNELQGRQRLSWVDEASESEEKAFAAITAFEAKGDTENATKAKAIYNSYKNKTKPYEELIKPDALIGKTSAELEDIKSTAKYMAGDAKIDTTFIDQKIKDAKLVEGNATARKYLEKATNENATLAQIKLATLDGASEDIIKHLTNLAEQQKKTEIEKNLAAQGIQGAQVFSGTYPDPKTGEKVFAKIISLPDGTQKLEDGTEVKATPLTEEEAKDRENISVQTQKVSTELNETGAAITEGLRNAETVVSMAKNDPRVRNAGGDVAQGITNFARGTESVISVLDSLFKGGKEFVTEAELKAALGRSGYRGDGIVDAFISNDVQSLADATARFEASILAFVFRSGRMEGQAGNAMSNKDFERLQEMLNVKGGIGAFETTVRNYMAEKIKNYDDKVVQFNTTGPIGSFVKTWGWSPVETPKTFSSFVELRNEPELTAAYQNTISYVPAAAPKAVDTSGDGANATNDFFNGKPFKVTSAQGTAGELTLKDVQAALDGYKQTYTGQDLIDKQEELITEIAGQMNMTVEKWLEMYKAVTQGK